MLRKRGTLTALLMPLAIMAQATAQHAHEGDFIIGVSGGSVPQLKFEFDPHILSGEEYIELTPSVNPAVHGWLGGAPGFEALGVDEPEEGLFTLASGAEIRLVGLDLDPGLFVRASTIGTPVRISPSPTLGFLLLGGSTLHTHAIWHVDSSAEHFDAAQTVWSGTFKFVDAGTTGYADSDPFTLSFITVPEPASVGLLILGGVLAGARRRR